MGGDQAGLTLFIPAESTIIPVPADGAALEA